MPGPARVPFYFILFHLHKASERLGEEVAEQGPSGNLNFTLLQTHQWARGGSYNG